MTLSDILSRLPDYRGRNGQYMAYCPAHDDQHRSLSVSEGDDGRILLHCQAGCSFENVLAASGLEMSDLFPAREPTAKNKPNEINATYPYFDQAGQLIAEKVRSIKYPKGIWRRPDGKGGWIYNRQGVPHTLYVAGSLASNSILIAEGEKDCNSLHALGFDAVSGMDGAGPGKWKPEYTKQLEGKNVCIFADNDDVGLAFAQETANALYGTVASLQLFDLRTVWPEIPEKSDITDLIEHFGADDALDKIAALITDTPQWKPSKENIKENASDEPELICAEDVLYEPPRWLIRPYLQKGKGTLIQADGGTGKTVFACGLAAAVTSGQPILGIPVEDPGYVIVATTEDDLPIIRGRIEANGGDISKVRFIKNGYNLTFSSPLIERFIQQVHAKMIIFDPFQAFLGSKIDMFRANETRPVLAQLFEVCKRHDCACLIICHTGKNTLGKSAVNLSLGSVDIPAACRSILHVVECPDNKDERIVFHIKSSNDRKGKSIIYSIGDYGNSQWLELSDLSLEDVRIQQTRKETGIPYEHEPLVQLFNQLITDHPGGGFWSYAELSELGAKILGFPPFANIGDLRKRLDGALARELQKRDGLIVTHSQRGSHNVRGIRIVRYREPNCYQTKITEA